MILRFLRSPFLMVVVLLLCQFALRTHHITVQQPYVDEGFHLRRAMVVWDFKENPGHFAHGKVLVYFWMGLFEGANTQLTILPVARLSIALFSMVTGAAIYLLGKILANHLTGVLALALYVILPPAFFYERMAMADPLAAGLMALAAWRCYVFVKRPTLWQGVLIGLLLGLTTLAKLTTIMVVLLPFAAVLLYVPHQEKRLSDYLRALMRRYLPGLILALLVGLALWLPMLIPALLARGTSETFILVNDANIADSSSEENFLQPLQYVLNLMPLLAEFLTLYFLAGAGLAALIGLTVFYRLDRRLWRSSLYLSGWLAFITLPAFFIARLTTTRYFMPAAVPLVLLLAVVIVRLMQQLAFSGQFSAQRFNAGAQKNSETEQVVSHINDSNSKLLSTFSLGALTFVLVLWLVAWVLPFARTTLTAPHSLPFAKPHEGFQGTNYAEYVAGYFLGDEAVQSAARMLNTLPPRPVYITWNLCHLMFFYIEQPVTCLPERTPRRTMEGIIKDLSPEESIYFIMADYAPFWEDIGGADFEVLGEYPRRLIKRPVYVLHMWQKLSND